MKSEKGSFSAERGFPLLVHWQNSLRYPEQLWKWHMTSCFQKGILKPDPTEAILSVRPVTFSVLKKKRASG